MNILMRKREREERERGERERVEERVEHNKDFVLGSQREEKPRLSTNTSLETVARNKICSFLH